MIFAILTLVRAQKTRLCSPIQRLTFLCFLGSTHPLIFQQPKNTQLLSQSHKQLIGMIIGHKCVVEIRTLILLLIYIM